MNDTPCQSDLLDDTSISTVFFAYLVIPTYVFDMFFLVKGPSDT